MSAKVSLKMIKSSKYAAEQSSCPCNPKGISVNWQMQQKKLSLIYSWDLPMSHCQVYSQRIFGLSKLITDVIYSRHWIFIHIRHLIQSTHNLCSIFFLTMRIGELQSPVAGSIILYHFVQHIILKLLFDSCPISAHACSMWYAIGSRKQSDCLSRSSFNTMLQYIVFPVVLLACQRRLAATLASTCSPFSKEFSLALMLGRILPVIPGLL